MPTIVTMPKWGLTMTTGTITGWSRQEGDPVTEGIPLLTVETEKAVDDVEAPASGILRKIVAEIGREVPVSGPVAVITAPGEDLSDDDLTALSCLPKVRHQLLEHRLRVEVFLGLVNDERPSIVRVDDEVQQE